MDASWLLAVAGFAVAMAGTPGPNNALVTASGANHGFRRTLPLMAGIALGVAGIMLVVAAAGASIVRDPRVAGVLTWVGVAYLLWLAWRIATAEPTLGGEGEAGAGAGAARAKPLVCLQGALFQLVNPKLWAMVAGAVAAYGGAVEGRGALAIAAAFGIVFGLATFASVAAWTLVGVGVGRLVRTRRGMRVFNGLMAALLVASLAPIVLG